MKNKGLSFRITAFVNIYRMWGENSETNFFKGFLASAGFYEK